MALGFHDDPFGCTLTADLAEYGTDCVRDADRAQIQARVLDKAAAAFNKHRQDPPALLGPHTLIPPKLIEDFDWPRAVLGMCYPTKATVRLNMRLLCDADSYENTLAHEIAHYVHFQVMLSRYGRLENMRRSDVQPHGRWWEAVMRAMGYEATVRGEADLSMAYPKQYAGMTCACGKRHAITRRRLKNVAARGGMLVCRCGHKIEPSMFQGGK